MLGEAWVSAMPQGGYRAAAGCRDAGGSGRRSERACVCVHVHVFSFLLGVCLFVCVCVRVCAESSRVSNFFAFAEK